MMLILMMIDDDDEILTLNGFCEFRKMKSYVSVAMSTFGLSISKLFPSTERKLPM